MRYQQIRVCGGVSEVRMGVTQMRHDEVAQQALRSAHGVKQLASDFGGRTERVDTWSHRRELESCGLDCILIISRRRDARLMASSPQGLAHSDVRVQVAE
jgi:hypothetical protein